MQPASIGVIGLAVMGQNLVLNMRDHGFSVAVFNRSTEKVDAFLQHYKHPQGIIGCHSIKDLVASLEKPKRILLMVRAGDAVDNTIAGLLPYLNEGDILIDGGNSLFSDTQRRFNWLKKQGIRFIGAGISGGEEGARFGPSIMPGGDKKAWDIIKPLFQDIAAKVGNEPCCHWIGSDGAGHYVKMVHNGIEYGDMQLIAEAYDILHRGAGLSNDELYNTFKQWNTGVLDSYLIEITANIFKQKDEDGSAIIDNILDAAGQKGTGKWTVNNALEQGTPLTLIAQAVFARALSSLKNERLSAEEHFQKTTTTQSIGKNTVIQAVHDALYASKIVSYAQGFMLLKTASETYNWQLNFSEIALIWRGGCIIRSRFLNDINKAFINNPSLENLLLDSFFTDAIKQCQKGWRTTLKIAIDSHIATPAMSSALAFFDAYTSGQSPANLIQAQRDYFGAHTYERTDKPRGEFFHTDWSKLNGQTSSTTYES
jgi:6-phosphogluconate dehydrogenase